MGDRFALPPAAPETIEMADMAEHAFLVVEDDDSVAQTLIRAIRPTADADRVATVGDAFDAISRRMWTGPALDLPLPDGSGFDLLEAVGRDGRRNLRVLVVTGSHDTNVANRAHRLGAACVFKPDVVPDLRVFVERAIAANADIRARRIAALRSLTADLGLTKREAELVELTALGVHRACLARQLGVSEDAIKTSVRHVLTKFGKPRMADVTCAVLEEIVRLSLTKVP